jgi:hypothetical protein
MFAKYQTEFISPLASLNKEEFRGIYQFFIQEKGKSLLLGNNII